MDDQPGTEGKGTTPVDQQQGETSTTDAGNATVSMTQAEFDRVIADRVKRAEAARDRAAAERLGMTLDEAEALAKSHREQAEAKKSELDRERSARETAERDRDAHRDQLAALQRERDYERALRKAGVAEETIPDAIRLTDFAEGTDHDYDQLASEMLKGRPWLAGTGPSHVPSTRGAVGRNGATPGPTAEETARMHRRLLGLE